MKTLLLSAASAVLFLTACGGPTQAAACKSYIACANALAPSAGAALDSTYGPNGTCWKDSSTATNCESACKSAMSALQANPAFTGNAACK